MKNGQEAMIQNISRLLGIYTHDMVEVALKQQNRCMNTRRGQGMTPTSREIIHMLSTARWHRVLRPGNRKHPTIYIYNESTGEDYNARKTEN